MTAVSEMQRVAHLEALIGLLPHATVERLETYLLVQSSGVLDPTVWRCSTKGSDDRPAIRWERADRRPHEWPPGLIHVVSVTSPANAEKYLPAVYSGRVVWMAEGETVVSFATLTHPDDPVALVSALLDLAAAELGPSFT